jgi:hypothetical protein
MQEGARSRGPALHQTVRRDAMRPARTRRAGATLVRSLRGAGGRGGGICAPTSEEPVATPGGICHRLGIAANGFAVHPVRRSISRWGVPVLSRVWTVMRRYGFKAFTPLLPPHSRGARVTSRLRSSAANQRRLSLLRRGNLRWPRRNCARSTSGVTQIRTAAPWPANAPATTRLSTGGNGRQAPDRAVRYATT